MKEIYADGTRYKYEDGEWLFWHDTDEFGNDNPGWYEFDNPSFAALLTCIRDRDTRLAKAEEVLREYARIYLSITGSRAREYFEEAESEDVDTAAPDSDDSAR